MFDWRRDSNLSYYLFNLIFNKIQDKIIGEIYYPTLFLYHLYIEYVNPNLKFGIYISMYHKFILFYQFFYITYFVK